MALTATASPSTRKDIIEMLEMKKPIIIMCPKKQNIIYTVEKSNDNDNFEPLILLRKSNIREPKWTKW